MTTGLSVVAAMLLCVSLRIKFGARRIVEDFTEADSSERCTHYVCDSSRLKPDSVSIKDRHNAKWIIAASLSGS